MKKFAVLMLLILTIGAVFAQEEMLYPFEKFKTTIDNYQPEGYFMMSCENYETEFSAIYMKGFEGILTISFLSEENIDFDETAESFILNKQKAYYIEEETDDGMFGTLIVEFPKYKMYCIIMEAPIVNEETKARLISRFEQLKF